MNHVEVKRKQVQEFSGLLGMITLVVLGRLVGDAGVAYLAAAVEAFAFLALLAADNVPDTLGRMLRGRNVRSQFKNIRRTRKNVMLIQCLTGAVCALFMALAADALAVHVLHVPYGALAVRMLAPGLFLRVISAVLLGYFQGSGTEMPTAAVSVLRQVFLLGFGILFVNIFRDYGAGVSGLLRQPEFTAMYGAAGAAVAAVLSEILCLLFLFLIHFGSSRKKEERQEGLKKTESFWSSAGILYGGMGTMILAGLLVRLPVWAGMGFFNGKAADTAAAAREFGLYYGKYLVVCGFCVYLLYSLLLPLCARSAAAFRKDDRRYARDAFGAALHSGLVWGLFAAVFAAALAGQLAGALCADNAVSAEKMLRAGSSAVLFVLLACLFARLLTLLGKQLPVLGALAVSDAVFAAVLLLTGGKNAGIMGLVYAGVAAGATACVLLGILAVRQAGLRPEPVRLFVMPAAAAAIAGGVCVLLAKVCTPHLGNVATLLVCFAAGSLLYWPALLLLRSFREQELKLLPGGGLLGWVGKMLRVF